jgi:hypothetical protein
MEKTEIYVRFANECQYYNKISIDMSKITDVNEIADEVFFTIDNLRVATSIKEWIQIKNNKNG